jgi:diaminohydroxyphosphoribosylaminopyrimidine deaminase/5-amino-6-(5-phosphoribosylamino)uracil reductase
MQLNLSPLDELALQPASFNIGQPYSERQAMQLAVQLAWRGLGKTSPNPLVGAVALDEYGRLLGVGHHEVIGGSHAEVAMWESIQKQFPSIKDLRGAKVFVSLEPCAHFGRTPPCADLLVKLQPRSVVYLMNDPNPKVAGSGAQKMQTSGIQVVCTHDPEAIGQNQNEIFLWRQLNQGKIFVGMKAATSMGGSIASLGDQRRWLTGERARRFAHFLRLRYDAIAIGANTAILDDPSLDPVGFGVNSRTPFKLVLDANLRAANKYFDSGILPKLSKADPAKVLWFCKSNLVEQPAVRWLEQAGCKIIQLREGVSATSDDILSGLKDFPIHSLLLEGGAGLYGPFLDDRRIQRLHEFMSPKFIGSTRSTIAIEAGRKTDNEIVLKNSRLSLLGQDLLIESWFEN